jgi:hypothetical protein
MKTPFITACLLIVCFSTICIAEDAAKAKATYDALVGKAKSGDKTVDFKQMRLSYSDSPSQKDTDPQKKAMFAALNSGSLAEAIKNADAVLAESFVDMDAHIVESIANQELKNSEQADFHKYIYQQLMKSITDSGDGKSPETAYVVIEVHEEYVLLRAMGIAALPKSQSLMNKSHHSYDVLVIEDPNTKSEQKIYFNVDIPIKHGV